MRILVFDSGIGGVGIAREIRALLPHAALTYLMDDAGFPYGDRQEADLAARVLHVLGRGIARIRPSLVVVACNTASTTALAALRAAHAIPFVGCVPPIRPAASASRSRTIGVLATPATVRGPYLAALAAEHAPACRVLIHGAAGLARLAEARFGGAAVAHADIEAELAGLLAQPGSLHLDGVALGCTHYGVLLPELRACLPPAVTWHDPAAAVARQVQRVAGTQPAGGEDGCILHTGVQAPTQPAGWAAAGLRRTERL